MRLPQLTAAEMRLIAPHLPPAGGPGKPRLDDKAFLSALC
jgi:transposase